MDRAKWIKAGLEIAEHLKAIQRIIEQNGMDRLSMASFLSMTASHFTTA